MPRLSIVIPWREGTPAFEDTLVSVLQHRPDRCEILVVHAEPYDDPYELAGEVRFIHVPARTEVALINAGLGAASADFVNVVRCGVEVQDGWADAGLCRFTDPAVACVAPLLVQRGNVQRLATAGVTYSRSGHRRDCDAGRPLDRWTEPTDSVLSPPLACGFYRRSVLLSMGGFDVALGEQYSDIDLGLTLAGLGFRCTVAAESVVVAPPARPRPSFRSGRQAELLYWRHAAPQDPGSLRHAATVLAHCCLRLPTLGLAGELLGRLAGFRQRKAQSAYQQQRHALARSAVAAATPSATRRTLRQAA